VKGEERRADGLGAADRPAFVKTPARQALLYFRPPKYNKERLIKDKYNKNITNCK